MGSFEEDQIPDWIESVTRFLGNLGFNRVQVRWKLMAWRQRWRGTARQTEAVAAHVQYRHRICNRCGSLQDQDATVCAFCGARFPPRFIEKLRRLGLTAPSFGSVTTLLTAACLAAYVRVALACGDFLSFDVDTLLRFGGNVAPVTLDGQIWRLATAVFLHAGLLHIAFNLFAFQQIGPPLENLFGRGRILFVFMVTGILASTGSLFLNHGGVSIGASGALMGLIGLAAGWGHQEGTYRGVNVRNQMVKWGLYTVVFGFFIGADNAAHIAGFLSGALLGLLYRPQGNGVPSSGFVYWFEWVFGSVTAALTLYLILVPPGLPV